MDHNKQEDPASGAKSVESLNWWAMLVVAVLAIPSIGIIVSSVSGTQGFFEVSIFIAACWICTYLGMRLMKNSKLK